MSIKFHEKCLKYFESMKMALLLLSMESMMLARIVRPAIQSLSRIDNRKPYSFSRSNLVLRFFLSFMKTSCAHFLSS